MAQNIVFSNDAVAGGPNGLVVPRPGFLEGSGFLGRDQRYFLFVFACFAVVGFLVIFVRSGTTGRYFAALRGSETAAASIGINGTRQRVLLFALSAGIAGLAGGIFAMNSGQVDFQTQEYQALFGAAWVVLVVSLGSRTVDGAVNAAISFVLFQWLLSDYLGMEAAIALIGFGFGAITYARHPEGIVEFRTRTSILERRKAALLKVRTAELRAAGPLPAGYLPGARVVLPALAGPVVLLLAIVVRRILGGPDGAPVWLIAVCVVPSVLFALGWIAWTHRRLVAHGGYRWGWWVLLGGTVVGLLVGWYLTGPAAEPGAFGPPDSWVWIDAPTWLGALVGAVCGFGVAAFFMLPVHVEQVARVLDFRLPPVTWRVGRAPTIWIVLGTFLCYWASDGWVPPFLWPLYLMTLVAAIVVGQWIGQVQGAVNELVIGEVDVAPGVPLAEDDLPETLPELTAADLAPSGGAPS